MSSRWNEALRNALTLRLGLWYAALFVGGATALLVFTYALLGQALAAEDHAVLESTLSRYAAEYERSGLTGLENLVEDDEGAGKYERLLVRVVNAQTELVYFAQPPGWGAFDLARLDDPAAMKSGWTAITNPADGSVLEVGSLTLPRGVLVQVGRSSHVRDDLLASFRERAFEVGLALVLIAGLGGILLTYVGLAPVRALEATSSAILQTGRFNARVATSGTRDPLDKLGAQINAMLGRIETLLTEMRGALDNVAHDLRTPLTRLRNVAESALMQSDPDIVRTGLALALEEAGRVNATLTALMDISEAETGAMTLRREPVRIAPLVDEAISLSADEAEDRRIVVESTVDAHLTLVVDRTRMRQVLTNLIENAVKYTDPGGRVIIDAASARGSATVTVRDTGIGIAPKDLPLVWDRLYRADASRSARGLGLGLSMVKAIVEAHGGHVEVASALGEGSTFSITLPAAGSERSPAGHG